MKKSYKYRIYPSKVQNIRLEEALDQACFLYNQLLDIKIQIYHGEGITLSCYDLSMIGKDFITESLHSQTKQNVAKRIDEAYKHFFRRCKQGKTPGFPKFHKRAFYKSITFPQYLNEIKSSSKIKVSKIGDVKVVFDRPITGKIKTLTIKKECYDKWFAVFSCDECPTEIQQEFPDTEVLGIDMGLSTYLAGSDGTIEPNPRWFDNLEKRMKLNQKRVSKKKKGSSNRRKQIKKLNQVHYKIKNQREDFLKKLARKLALKYKYIGIETLNISGMLKNHCLAKSISDASWGMFLDYLRYYKTIFEGEIVEIGCWEPTTKTCSGCGHKQKMGLKDRIFKCAACGLELDRDYNASLNIKKLAIKKLVANGIKLNAVGLTVQACGDDVRLMPLVLKRLSAKQELNGMKQALET